jgi:hypothetical protein
MANEKYDDGSGCFWKMAIIAGIIIGIFCYIREKINDWQWEKEIAERKEQERNPPPVKKQRPVTYHYHTCSMCRKRCAEEYSFPNEATWCERCEKWHCGDCKVNCIANE